jgi:FixJ family two-component response regulator
MGFPSSLITADGDIPMTVRAMKAGAVEFLTKPFRLAERIGIPQSKPSGESCFS